MPAEKKRVFVGNLPADTTQADVTKLFSNFGSVLSVEIKQHPNSSTFAFLDMKTDEDKLKSCFATLAARKWNGNRIKVELAKESFLSRLEKERQELDRSQPRCSSDGNHMIDPSERSKKHYVEELKFTKKKWKADETVRELNDSKADETVCELNDLSFDEESFRSLDAASGSETLFNGKLKMFGGTKTAFYDSDNDKTHSQSMPDSKMSQSTCTATGLLQRLTLFSDVWDDPPMNCDLIKDNRTVTRKDNHRQQNPSDEGKRCLAEEKRKKSVDEKRKSSQKQKEAIKLSLSCLDSGQRNRKTVFDSEDYDNKTEDTVKQIVSHQISSLCYDELLENSDKKTVLFEGASDDESDGNFKVKSQFEGSKGQKLLELQSQFASDKRFALDERFYESDEVLDDTYDTVKTAAGAEDERRRQLEILQDVLGHQIHTKDNKKDKYKGLSMLRFDPMNPDHAKFKKETEPTIKKKVIDISPDNKIPEVVCGKGEDRTENVLVSKEKFYTVAECLKESLKKRDEGNEFSLLKLFGASDGGPNDEESRVTYSATTLNEHKHKNWTINPFKYDSSDSEKETEVVSYNKTDNLQQNLHKNVFYFGESFFFKASDPRLQEGLEFFNRNYIKDESYDFAKHRRELKQIVRMKVKNNMCNHRPWRKKLGGHKAQKFRKYTISCSY